MCLHADSVDHRVGTAVVRELPYGGYDVVVLFEIEHLDAVAPRHLEPHWLEVHAEDTLCAPVTGDAGAELSDGSEPVNSYGAALRDIGRATAHALAVGKMSERYKKRSSGASSPSSGTFMGPKWACGTRRYSACPPGT